MLLNEVEPDTRVTVRTITGGLDVKNHLKELGIVEGVELTVISTEPVHVHAGPILLKVDDNEVVIARGWADKVYVASDEGAKQVLKLEAGDSGVIRSIEGGKEFEKYLSELGIRIGAKVSFVKHLPDDTMIFSVSGNEVKMGEGMASKVLVESDRGNIQANNLKKGVKSRIVRIIGGDRFKDRMELLKVVEGAEIELTGMEPSRHEPGGRYVTARIDDKVVTIGYGLAEKVEVE
ncbi:MAG TPA: ferrous iron transport protein A [Candidatus Syntrophoarchaeum butanivorans]|uniref:Ferrous iron transport protein A n=1 Tax=Candidatus Syntropharchaeum butanivorans TaxID=1839936 RepID=A0A7C1B5I6_9EURY|nr:ferrous iron transport protein A [Candidatus Syntrophoarchaeum butanivorans]